MNNMFQELKREIEVDKLKSPLDLKKSTSYFTEVTIDLIS